MLGTPPAGERLADGEADSNKEYMFCGEKHSGTSYELPQRTRYYQALMALDQIGRGERYSLLKDSYVVFICDFDPFGDGQRVYWFENTCRGNSARLLGDGAKTVFLAATAPREGDAPDRLNELLDYVASGSISGELSGRLDAEVARVLDNKKWRLEYVIQQVREQLSYDRGEAIGLAKGEEIGQEKGEAAARERIVRLAAALQNDGRAGDLMRALAEPPLLEHLCTEYGIS